eukprot:4746757-Ditylum_brightwellii.AAC.1
MKIYPYPIVDEKKTAKEAKDKVSSIKKLESTKQLAQAVYVKHGSRSKRMRADDTALNQATIVSASATSKMSSLSPMLKKRGAGEHLMV